VKTKRLKKIEVNILAEDAVLLERIAAGAGMSVSELVRNTLYNHLESLQEARNERINRSRQEVKDRRKLDAWGGTRLEPSTK
jgi:hypothetical protein